MVTLDEDVDRYGQLSIFKIPRVVGEQVEGCNKAEKDAHNEINLLMLPPLFLLHYVSLHVNVLSRCLKAL